MGTFLPCSSPPARDCVSHTVTPIDVALEAYAVRLGELRKQMDTEMEQRLELLSAAERTV